MPALKVVGAVELWPSTVPQMAKSGDQVFNTTVAEQQIETALRGTRFPILGPHEYTWISIYPYIVSAEGEKEKAFVDFIAFIWGVSVPRVQTNSGEEDNEHRSVCLSCIKNS